MSDPENTVTSPEEPKAPVKEKEVLATKVTGTVKWFNVKSGYGFINRHDTKEDVFVHQSAITKNNPRKYVRSVGDGEDVEFDVVVGEKGNEAANVTGPGGEAVKGSPYAHDKYPPQGSPYAADRRRGYRRRYYRRAAPGEEGEVEGEGVMAPPMRGRGRGGFRGRGPRRFYRGRFFGRGRGRGGGRGGYDQGGYMNYGDEGMEGGYKNYGDDGMEDFNNGDGMSMRGRGRGRGRGGRGDRRGGGRGPRGYFRRYYGGSRPQPEGMMGGPGPGPGGPSDGSRPGRGRFRRGGRGDRRGRGGRLGNGPETKGDGQGQEGSSAGSGQPQQAVENTTAESSA